ncbi:ammonia-dependent NAD(+) synthetase [Variovorax sp. J22G73]|uniref:ammonia-dependent NAD(+) synthetase n=1 Tax=unclassified Variovorax TaxID=663243 RepID=UPI002577E636|nr:MULTISPECIES: ammonia-dependent NAD(+) synthetase [unclassified Variovorax]MDM0008898.1 ammonia-dependent NAD(+) synthetase [Variovorax sp. J22R203]MDM0101266.1 ammonia-dependent NAD(+) synthetase [Variovorax sp. J22G73]
MSADLSPVDATQREIIAALHVAPVFDAASELERRVDFLASYLKQTGLKTLVLGISGGVDSLTAGCLAQRAVQKLRAEGRDATFIAMRLPYGVQKDEAEAQASLAVIQPDRTITVDIRPAADGMLAALKAGDLKFRDAGHEDFVLGNIKARERMVAQFAVAGAHDGIVIGTDHAAEALMGFFTKFGDGAADITPLTGLNKRRVRAVAQLLGAPDALVYKVPTADLESLVPGKPDEDAFGVTYEQIDDFLEGKPVSARARDIILSTHRKSAHKRALPVEPAPPATHPQTSAG